MTKKDELKDPNSCINRAHDDEPVFVIRAHDPIGAFVVQTWIDRAIKRNLHQDKIEEAIDCATAFLDWREKMGLLDE